jgi:rRNA biogenesis protein RRP5
LLPGNRVDGEKRRVEMSLRTDAKPKAASFNLGDLQEGHIVDGIVKRIERYGVFVRIAGSNISGLCHKSEVRSVPPCPHPNGVLRKRGTLFQILDGDSDDGEGWDKKFKAGDAVKAVVLGVQRDEQKVSFSLKPSRFPAALDGDRSVGETEVADEDAASDDLEIHPGGEQDSDDEVDDEDVKMENAPVGPLVISETIGFMIDVKLF